MYVYVYRYVCYGKNELFYWLFFIDRFVYLVFDLVDF